MKALLLIGGQATRLYPLNKHVAKSLMPICDRELLHYQIVQLARAGINQIGLAAGHLVDQLREFTAMYTGGLEFNISLEPTPLGTAGAIAQAREWIGDDQVVVLNADILANLDISEVIARHNESSRPATIVGYGVDDPSQFGLLKTEGDELSGFSEKPEGVLPEGKHFINAGVYVLEPEVVSGIPTGRKVSIEREVFPRLLDKHGALTHFPHEGVWIDIGTFENYFRANFILLARRYEIGEDALWGQRDDGSVFKDIIYISKYADLGRNTDLFHRVVMMREAATGSDVKLRNTVLMPRARIGSNCELTNCIVGPGAQVADGSRLNNLIIIAGEENTPFFPETAQFGAAP